MDYAEIGHHLQIERGQVKPSQPFIHAQGLNAPETISQAESVQLFNQIAEKNGLKPLKDPKGYQKLDNNAYDMLHDTYKEAYQRKIDQAHNKMIQGGPYAFEAMLDKSKMNGTIQKEIRTHLPKGTNYTDLKYVKANPMMKKQAQQMFNKRAEITNLHNIRRSVEEQRMNQVITDFNHLRDNTVQTITDALNGKVAKPSLSIKQLQQNSHNNVAGLKDFVQNMKNPQVYQPDMFHDRAHAEFKTKNLDTAKFLMSNKSYLKEFGFKIEKQHGEITTSWQSEKIDKMAQQQAQESNQLNLSSATAELNQNPSQAR